MTRVRIATRRSELALWQAREVGRRIEAALHVPTELVPLRTTGDELPGPLSKVGGKGLFIKEIEEALLDHRADVAVHSAKDLPAAPHSDLALVAFPERADPRDALVARDGAMQLAQLPHGARVGTGSVRRTAQLLRARPDLVVVPLRGNVQTRLRKLEEERLDALVLACAGLDRLELDARISERIPPELLLPAVGQGALAVQVRAGEALAADLGVLDHPQTAACIAAERAFLAGLEGDCSVPLAALASLGADGLVRLRGMLFSIDGTEFAEAETHAPVARAAVAGEEAARRVLQEGGDALLASLHGATP